MKAASALIHTHDWKEATRDAVAEVNSQMNEARCDLALVFAHHSFSGNYEDILAEIQSATKAKLLAGCSGQGIIGQGREIEGEPALALMALNLPGAALKAHHFKQAEVEEATEPGFWHVQTGIEPREVNAWILLADPFTLDVDALVQDLNEGYPATPIIGGMASGDHTLRQTTVFLNGQEFGEGGVGIALGGEWTLQTVVSQGCKPIGEPWTITRAEQNIIHQIARKPAYQVLVETFRGLSKEDQQRAQHNLLVGLAINEYQEEFKRGDFLIRNIVGVDPKQGSMAVGALPRAGQTIQFQLRDAAAATEDMAHVLDLAKQGLGGQSPLAGLLCCCNGRGENLFGTTDHDAKMIKATMGAFPLSGFFCNGEIGPVGTRTFLHGFTASLGLFVRKR